MVKIGQSASNNTSTAPTTTHNNINFIWNSHFEVNEIFLNFTYNVFASPVQLFEKESNFNPAFGLCGPLLPFQYLTSTYPSPHNEHLPKWGEATCRISVWYKHVCMLRLDSSPSPTVGLRCRWHSRRQSGRQQCNYPSSCQNWHSCDADSGDMIDADMCRTSA